MQETIRVIQAGKRRVKIFVDFWNVMIDAQRQTSNAFDLAIRWDALASSIVRETSGGYGDETTSELAGCYVFGSYEKSDPRHTRVINRVLDDYGSCSGLFFDFSDRVKKETLLKCEKCDAKMTQSSESGVDVLLCVEMVKHAAMREHEYLALVSNDRDFLPMLAFLKDKGERVIHAMTGKGQREMRAVSWKQINLSDQFPQLCKISTREHIILTIPSEQDRLKQAISLMEEHKLAFKVLDVTKKEQISDKDLEFILRNQMISFDVKEGNPRVKHGVAKFSSIREIREKLAEKIISSSFPYVFYDSKMEARGDDQWNWIVAGGYPERWRKYQTDPFKKIRPL